MRKAFTPGQLARDFGPASPPVRAAGIDWYANDAGLLPAVCRYYAGFIKALAGAAAGLRAVELVGGEGEPADAEAFAAALDEYDPATLPRPGSARDLLGLLYERLFPRRVRHGSGEYYTPEWLAEHVLDGVGFDGDPDCRLLDPACGSGTFLIAAINRIRLREAAGDGSELCRRIIASVTGFELNPLAAMAAKANYAIAMRDLLPGSGVEGIPVRLRDTVLTPPEPDDARADFVVGNPPWIAWDDLPAAYRERVKPACARYGLFSLPASAARHGGGKKDLSMLLLYAAVDGWLRDGGRLGFVVTQSLFQTKGAGDGFRHFRLGADGPPLGVYRVDDMAGLRLFGNTASRASVVFLRKGEETRYPVRYVRWMRGPGGGFSRVECEARPVDPGRQGSQWIITPSAGPRAAGLVGRADYEGHLGANTGGANGVYWVEVLERRGAEVLVRNLADAGKQPVPAVLRAVESGLLYPLVRWHDVRPWRGVASAYILLAQDPQARTAIPDARMREMWPMAYEYLRLFEDALLARAAYRRYQEGAAFYAMYDVGGYTLAPWKVVWRRMDSRLTAAVLGEADDGFLGRRAVVPQETCAFIACGGAAEAHYLCALLNSAAASWIVRSHSIAGGKGFGSPGMLEYLPLRRYRPECSEHAELAALSEEAHREASRGEDMEGVQRSVDALSARLFGLSAAEAAALITETSRSRRAPNPGRTSGRRER